MRTCWQLALWLKENGFRADQVQAFLPSPMATATAMYHSGVNPLRKVTRDSERVTIPKGFKVRRLHKAFLRYHDANNWPLLREALRRMGRADLIGNGKRHLVPSYQPAGTGGDRQGRPQGCPQRRLQASADTACATGSRRLQAETIPKGREKAPLKLSACASGLPAWCWQSAGHSR